MTEDQMLAWVEATAPLRAVMDEPEERFCDCGALYVVDGEPYCPDCR
jgi:hypothetical protein